jgi:hypothetical protein
VSLLGEPLAQAATSTRAAITTRLCIIGVLQA